MTATPTRRAVALGAAHDRLHLALAAAERAGQEIPCRVAEEPQIWISEDPDERAEAASLCEPCPVRAVCQETAIAAKEAFGVWGGRDLAPPKPKPTPPKPKPAPKPARCSVGGCTNPVRARGFCNSHYARWRRYGDPLGEGEGRWPK